MPCAKGGVLHPLLAMHRPFVAMRRLFPAMLHAFAATLYEGEDAIYQESRGHRARPLVLFPVLTVPRLLSLTTLRRSRRRAVGRGHPVPSWREPREREERPSPDKATLRTKLGMLLMQFETPNEERTAPM